MLLIRNGNVYLGGGRYEPGWDVLCEGSLIKAVGPALKAEDAQVIDASGMDVYPGLVLGLCSVGAVSFGEFMAQMADHNETTAAILPHMDIRDAFDYEELKRQRFARAGITSYGLCPGTNALVAGQIALAHVAAERAWDVFVAGGIAVKGNFTKDAKQTYAPKNVFMTRMGMYQCLHEAFRGAQEYMKQEEKPYDACKEALCRLLRGELPFVVAAETQAEIEGVMRIAEEFGIRLVITGGFGAAGLADRIIAGGHSLMIGDSGYMAAGLENRLDLAALLEASRRGLKLSLSCSGDVAYPSAYEQLLWMAARMRAAGAEGSEVMDMMTIRPAEALGVEAHVGSIAEGKQADVIICRGNPAVRYDNYIEYTVVGGRVAFERKVN